MPKGIPKNRPSASGEGGSAAIAKRGRPKKVSKASATTKSQSPEQLCKAGYEAMCRERDQLTADLSEHGPKQQRLEWLNRCIPLAAECAGIPQLEMVMTAGSSNST